MIGAAFLLIGFIACQGDQATEQNRPDALAGRIEHTEKRVTAHERGVEPAKQLPNEVATLNRRVTSADTGSNGTSAWPVPAVAARQGIPSSPAAWEGTTPRELRQVRRAQLHTLNEEYRSRLYQFRGEQPDSPAEQQQRLEDTRRWYREQRRTILRGKGRTDQ